MTRDPSQELLERLANGHLYTLVELAAELDIAPELLAQMIQDLTQAGYLRAREDAKAAPSRAPVGFCMVDAAGWLGSIIARLAWISPCNSFSTTPVPS